MPGPVILLYWILEYLRNVLIDQVGESRFSLCSEYF